MENFNFDILKEENALIVFLSQVVTSVSDKMLSLGLIWYITKNLGAEVVPWFLVCAFLPHLILSFSSAKIIHYFGVLKSLSLSTLFRAFILIITFILINFYSPSVEQLKIILFTMVFFIGVGASIFTPAILSSPPLIIEEDKLISLNGLLDSTFSFSSILGAVISVFLLSFIEIKHLILFCSFLFFFAFFIQLRLRSKKIEKSEDEQQGENKVSLFAVFKKYKDISSMLTVFLVFNLMMTPIFVLIPWYLENIYKGNSIGLSLIEGGLGAGAFITGILISSYKIEINDRSRVKMISIICFIFGILFFLFSQSSKEWHAIFIMFFIGAASAFLNIQILTFFQVRAASEDVPAVMALVNLISNASVPISLALSGIVFPMVSIPNFSLVLSILIITLSLTLPRLINGDLNAIAK